MEAGRKIAGTNTEWGLLTASGKKLKLAPSEKLANISHFKFDCITMSSSTIVSTYNLSPSFQIRREIASSHRARYRENAGTLSLNIHVFENQVSTFDCHNIQRYYLSIAYSDSIQAYPACHAAKNLKRTK